MKYKKPLIIGLVFGLIAPVFGLFLGLQVSATLGNIFTFPWILISVLTDSPFGNWGSILKLLAFAFSGIVWSLVFFIINQLLKRK